MSSIARDVYCVNKMAFFIIAIFWYSYANTRTANSNTKLNLNRRGDKPLGFQEIEASRLYIQSAYKSGKIVRHTLWPPLFSLLLSRPHGHSAAERSSQ
jgi:hypothetical protein